MPFDFDSLGKAVSTAPSIKECEGVNGASVSALTNEDFENTLRKFLNGSEEVLDEDKKASFLFGCGTRAMEQDAIANSSAKSFVEAVLAAGRYLLGARKAITKRGQWECWIRNHFKCSTDKARSYMRLARFAMQHERKFAEMLRGGGITSVRGAMRVMQQIKKGEQPVDASRHERQAAEIADAVRVSLVLFEEEETTLLYHTFVDDGSAAGWDGSPLRDMIREILQSLQHAKEAETRTTSQTKT